VAAVGPEQRVVAVDDAARVHYGRVLSDVVERRVLVRHVPAVRCGFVLMVKVSLDWT
jgi:hypothetical protein